MIKAFTFFFSPVFGAILMAMNMAKAKQNEGIFRVILFGVGIILAENVIVAAIGLSPSINIIVAFLNAYLIDLLFWDKYIGKATLYKPRSFWAPLIIGLAISALLVVTLLQQAGSTHVLDGLLPKNTK